METIREFIEKAVREYNTGQLTPEKLCFLRSDYRFKIDSEHEDINKNLDNAHEMLYKTFVKQKGKNIK